MAPVRRAVAQGVVAEDLKAEVSDLGTEMRTEFATARDEMRAGFASVRGEMHEGFAALRGAICARDLPRCAATWRAIASSS
jgi:hypothetical protein